MVDIGSVLFHLDETVLVRVGGLGETLLLRSTILKPDLGGGANGPKECARSTARLPSLESR